jgi:hypothetical protein
LLEDSNFVLENPLFTQDDIYNPVVYAQIRNIANIQQNQSLSAVLSFEGKVVDQIKVDSS